MDQTETSDVSVDSAALRLLADGEQDVKPIIESELAEYFEHATVKSIVIDETEEGFCISVTLTWRKDGPFRLVTYRGKAVRYWRSADRLVNYLKSFDNVPPIVLRLAPRTGEAVARDSED